MENNVLRLRSLKDFIGQDKVIKALSVSIEAAKINRSSVGHSLFYGMPGLGKTTLSSAIAKEMNTQIINVSAPALKKPKDLIGILNDIEENFVLFIDEIHRLDKVVQEYLYSVMEDFCIDIVSGSDADASSIRLHMPKFTLVGATTKLSLLDAPILSRFINIYKLEEYSEEELSLIIKNNIKKFNMSLSDESIALIASASRGTPRLSNNIILNLYDWVTAHKINFSNIPKDEILKLFNIKNINRNGITESEINILKTLKTKGCLGILNIAHICNEDRSTIETVYEPFLIKNNLILKTQKGREITSKGIDYLNKSHF